MDTGFKTATDEERGRAARAMGSQGLHYVNSDIPIFKPVDGQNTIRLVPPLASDIHATLWGLEIRAYYLNSVATLSSETFDSNVADPIKDHFFATYKIDPEGSKPYRSTKRFMMFVLDLNASAEGELKLWAAPPTVVNTFVNLAKNKRTGEMIPLEDPVNGRPIFFEKTGKGISTSYNSIEVDKEPLPLNNSILEQLDVFANILIVPTADDLQQILDSSLAAGCAPAQPAPVRARVRPSEVAQAPAPATQVPVAQVPVAQAPATQAPVAQAQAPAPAPATQVQGTAQAPVNNAIAGDDEIPFSNAPVPESAGTGAELTSREKVMQRIAARKKAQETQ